MPRPFHSRKNSMGKRKIFRIGLQLVGKDAGVESDPPVAPK